MLPTRGYIFIGLNVIRILSIIALLLVLSSSIETLVHDVQAVNRFVAGANADNADPSNSTLIDDGYIPDSTVPHQPAGAFWAVLNRLLIIGQTIVLLLSELSCASRFFDKFFPVLGREFGLGALGLFQCLIGAAVLSHHVDELSVVSAFFLFSVGCVNILFGLIWREKGRSKRSLTDWREAKKDVLPSNLRDLKIATTTTTTTRHAASPPPSFHSTSRSMDEKMALYDHDTAPAIKWSGYGFGRQGEKAAAGKGYLITKPLEALPRYVPNQTAGSPL